MVNIRKTQFTTLPIYTSGCAQLNSCQSNERQNFGSSTIMRQLHTLQCRPFNYGGPRFFRPVNCNFCHKMGTWDRSHLLFQNDTIGTNDPTSILLVKDGKWNVLDLEKVYSQPYRYITPNNVLSDQEWYMVSKPYYK